MKLLYFDNQFPNEDLQELYRGLAVRSKDRGHPLLARFIDNATSAVREELRLLSSAQRALFPPFESVFDFSDHPQLRKGPLCGSVEGVLLCVLQLAILIGYFEDHPEEFALDPADTNLTGLGTGLLATAAVSIAPTLAELPWVAAEVVRVAFRLGVHVDGVSENLEPRDLSGGTPDTWAAVIPGISPDDVQRELEAYRQKEHIPESGKIFISALSRTSVTISGPPSRLKVLFRDHDFFRDRQYINLPVYGGLCHAGHVFGQSNVRTVVRTKQMELVDSRLKPRVPVFSTSTGEPYKVDSAAGLFEAIVSELLTQAIQWDKVVDGIVEKIDESSDPAIQVAVFGKSQATKDLLTALKGVPGLEVTPQNLNEWVSRSPDADFKGPRGPAQSKIAIVGMSCRLPGGATNTEKFWELLEKGLDVHRRIPADRFDLETHFDPTGKSMNKTPTEYGCFIDEPGLFDAPFFNISPKEAQQTDPQGRLALVTAYEALERAGYVPNRLGQGHFLTTGPNACKTWDSEADGYCRADAVGSIVMKRLEDAEADNDNIMGVILSAATNHSAEAISITHPLAEAQSELTRMVMNRAGVDPLDVGFVEMHGTGTQAGDMEEIKSVTDVFAPIGGAARRRSPKQPLYIGAVKSNVGHSESAAGITALIKVLLMFQKGFIPRHVGIKNSLTPKFPKDIGKRNVHIPFEQVPWPRIPGKKRIAVVNNFSAAGGNTSIAIEEPPVRPEPELSDPRAAHVVTVSAKSKKSLEGNLKKLIAYLDAYPDVSLASLSYTTTARRHHHSYRVTVCATETALVKKHLESKLAAVDSQKPIAAPGSNPIAFAFTGQGASYRSMNLELYHDCPFFRSQIQNLDSLAQSQGFPSFIPAVDGSFPQDHAHSPVVTQLALVSIEIALARYWNLLGIQPSVVIGHSLGEYAAMHVAGVLSASDAIYLVGKRAQLLEKKCHIGSHKMMAVTATLDEIEKSAGGAPYEVACINGPKQVVLSGPCGEIDSLEKVLKDNGHRCQVLEVAFAFHSAQTDAILDEFEAIAKTSVDFKEPQIPFVSSLLSKVVCDSKTLNANYVRRATRETVDFVGALDTAQKQGMIEDSMAWIEIGPHPVCMGFVKANIPSTTVAVPSIRRGQSNWTTLAETMSALHSAGVEVNWNEFHGPFENKLRLLDLPTYAWNDKNYWMQYKGDWCLTKGNTFYVGADKTQNQALTAPLPESSLRTSSVHQILEESIYADSGKVVMQSDLMQKDFFDAAHGHSMNGCGVVTSSIHADIAYTLGDYLYKKIRPDAGKVDMDVRGLNVLKGLVSQKYIKTPQLVRVSAEITDIDSGVAQLKWYNVTPTGDVEDPFASAELRFGQAKAWLDSWSPMTHLIQSRIEALEQMSVRGEATRFSHNMAYRLFANNLVDYASKYRGMQSVVLHELEAFAEVTLSHEKAGSWTIPPQYIDSVAHLAGFIMNCSDAMDTQNNFCVTPGWKSMRFATKFEAGAKYRSYVKMIPTAEDPSVFMGDVYILQNDAIVGMVGGITFRKYPRVLLNRFFSPPDADQAKTASKAAAPAKPLPAPKPKAATEPVKSKGAPEPAQAAWSTSSGASTPLEPMWTPSIEKSEMTEPATPIEPSAQKIPAPLAANAEADAGEGSDLADKAMRLIADETAIDEADLVNEASFASLGVDSLMSLVIAEKFRDELGVQVSGGLFLEYPTIGDLRGWLVENYS
ncbi:polyketide [Diaporthe amygdali]|uniref:polyketide n=1 Tax=Phomopsis amygdali TaxID=1214568 RepID=UPI0022FE97A4|nr:polyketide [Diaporthe amygdali]KAJ0107113.1 polyketide [Diaporthe amygdali]